VHTAAHGPPRTHQRETVTVAAGRSKIHTCRTDDTGLPVTASHGCYFVCCRIPLYGNRVGGGVAPPPLTPPDMRARIRRFVKPFGRDAARFG
jgi:hypothetical protein